MNMKTKKFEEKELGTLRRLLRAELHQMLNTDVSSWGFKKVEHDELVKYKFRLLQKLGSSENLQQIKIYESHC